MEGKMMINTECTESIKHWVSWWTCPSSETAFGILQKQRKTFFPRKRELPLLLGHSGENTSLSQADTLYMEMLSLEATTFPSACSPAVLSEEDLRDFWDTRQLRAGCFCLNCSPGLWPISCPGLSACGKVQPVLNYSHGRNWSSCLSLTCISDAAGRELRARRMAVLPASTTVWQRPDSYTSPFSCHWRLYCLRGLKDWLPLV